MGTVNSYNPIISTRRKGTMDDPYINIEESFVVKDNKVLLSEIPSEIDHVQAIEISTGEVYYEIFDGIPGEREFIVDYRFGIITFHPYANDKNIKFTYVGTGNYYLPAKRVWTKQNNGTVEETLGDIIEQGQEAIKTLAQVETITNNAIVATENANNVATLISNAEESRVIAETSRDNAENLRMSNENERQSQETIRLLQEEERVNNENLRISAENERINAESIRVSNESIRQSQEEIRQNNELIRQSNEVNRQEHDAEFQVWEEYNPEKLYRPLNKVVYQGSSFLCKQQCQGVSPSDANYWLKIASAGAGTLVEDSDINGNIKINSSETIVYRHPDTHPASIIEITDDGEYFESTNVEDALQEIASEIKIKSPEYSEPQEATSSVITLPNHVVEGQFSDIVLKGNTQHNKATFGGCEETTGWNAANVTVIIDNTNKYEGTNCLKITLSVDGEKYIERNVLNLLDKTKYYLITAHVKNNNLSNGMKIGLVSDNGIVLSGLVTATSYNRVGIVVSPSNIDAATYAYLRIYVNGVTGQYGYVDAISILEITAAEYAEGATALMAKKPYTTPGGVVSTESVRVKSVGKNLFDKNAFRNLGYVVVIANGTLNSSASDDVTDYIQIKPNTSYVFTPARYGAWYDANKKFISSVITGVGVSPANAKYVRYTIAKTAIDTAQIEEGTVATPYEPYTETEAYIDGELRSLPNGTFDEINVITGERKQRIKKYVLQASDFEGMSITPNSQRIYTKELSDAVNLTNGINNDFIIPGYPSTSVSGGAGSDQPYTSFHVSRRFYIHVPLGTYADITAARAALAGTTLIYQLATPIVSEYPYSKLMAYPNGHLIVEPVVFDVGYYSGGIQVEKTHLPIKSLDYVAKIDVDTGALTYIDLTKCTVAADGLSFTITDANNTEYYEYAYYYDSSLTTLPTVKYSYPMNTVAAIDGNTKAIAKISNDLDKTAKMVTAHIKDEIPHIYKDRNTTAEYRLVVIDGRPYLEVVKV